MARLELWQALRFDELCARLMPSGREAVAWGDVVAILTIARLCEPSSELHVAEDWYRSTALEDLLGVAVERIYDERLYRALDRVLPHKEELEKHLVERLGELFAIEYDLLLYDVTSTYFEGVGAPEICSAATAATIDRIVCRSTSRWWSRARVFHWGTRSSRATRPT